MDESISTSYLFIIPLVLGFVSHCFSSFTSYYSDRWGKKIGTFLTIILRDVTGIPLWAIGFLLSIQESGDLLFITGKTIRLAGWIVIAAGGLVILAALFSIRIKAAAPSRDDKLVDTGIYSVIRHPIHTGTGLEFIGLFILWPAINVAVSMITGLLWIYIQSVLEERDLRRRMPGYEEYAGKTPRFFPNLLQTFSAILH